MSLIHSKVRAPFMCVWYSFKSLSIVSDNKACCLHYVSLRYTKDSSQRQISWYRYQSPLLFWPVLKQKLGIWGLPTARTKAEMMKLVMGAVLGTAQSFRKFSGWNGENKTFSFWNTKDQRQFCTEGNFGNSATYWTKWRQIKTKKLFSNWPEMIENGKYLLFG